ncbi:polysaccharide deacetylase family protein [Alkalilimnicola ehrlichii]|uniref:polysaccharide deacetylase family protein n=1 Tax=Alkalilimnicola ehrlichii TaxID=351052 RepID=UPI003BA1DC3B
MPTRVHITVDTEFSIAGAFRDPQAHQPVGPPSVYCHIGGRSEGLGHLLDTLEAHGLRGTFYVETLNTCFFGDEPMGAIAREIAARGHDMQLHLHPCWTYFEHEDWPERLAHDPPNDDVTRRSVEELVALIERGRATFRRWGLPAPTVLRTGGLKVGLNVYRAMRQAGMEVASNIGLAIYRPAEPELQLLVGCHDIDGVLEFPVTTYSDFRWGGRTHYKTLTITGTSWPEMRRLLTQARDQGLSDVVVLTHPFEFIKHRDREYRELHVDRITRGRLERLCRFVSSEPGLEPVCTGELVGMSQPTSSAVHSLQVPAPYALARMLINRLNHSALGGS